MEWSKFHRLVDDTVTRLRNAEGDREKVESAIRRYLNQGYKYVIDLLHDKGRRSYHSCIGTVWQLPLRSS